MHPIGISIGVVKFECTISNPMLSNFNALNTGCEEELQGLWMCLSEKVQRSIGLLVIVFYVC